MHEVPSPFDLKSAEIVEHALSLQAALLGEVPEGVAVSQWPSGPQAEGFAIMVLDLAAILARMENLRVVQRSVGNPSYDLVTAIGHPTAFRVLGTIASMLTPFADNSSDLGLKGTVLKAFIHRLSSAPAD